MKDLLRLRMLFKAALALAAIGAFAQQPTDQPINLQDPALQFHANLPANSAGGGPIEDLAPSLEKQAQNGETHPFIGISG